MVLDVSQHGLFHFAAMRGNIRGSFRLYQPEVFFEKKLDCREENYEI